MTSCVYTQAAPRNLRELETREREIRVLEMMLQREVTAREIGCLLGVSTTSAGHFLRRMRERGVPIEVVGSICIPSSGAGRPEAAYRVVLPSGRVCSTPGCGTVLRRTNPSDRCEIHGGGFYADPELRRATSGGRRRCRGYSRGPHMTDDWSPSSREAKGRHLCRECESAYWRAYKRSRKEGAACSAVAR